MAKISLLPPRFTLAAILISSALSIPGNVMPILAGLLVDHYHIDERLIGYLISTNTAAALCVSTIAPWWITRIRLRLLVPAFVLIVAACYLLFALSPNFTGLLLLELVIGAAGGAVAAACYTVMAQHNAAHAWAIKIVADVLIAWTFVKFVPNTNGILPFTIALCAAMSAFALLGLALPKRVVMAQDITQSHDATASEITTATPLQLPEPVRPVPLREAPLAAWLALFVVVLFTIGAVGVWPFVQRMELRAGISGAATNDVFALGLLLGISGALLAALLGNRLGRVVPPGVAGALLVASLAAMSITHSQLIFTVAFIGLNATWNFFLPYMMGLLTLRDSTQRLSSLVNAALTTGSIIGPSLAGTLIHASGYPLAITVQGVLISAAVALYVAVAVSARRSS